MIRSVRNFGGRALDQSHDNDRFIWSVYPELDYRASRDMGHGRLVRLARREADRFYQTACELSVVRTPWSCRKGLEYREPAVPALRTSKSS